MIFTSRGKTSFLRYLILIVLLAALNNNPYSVSAQSLDLQSGQAKDLSDRWHRIAYQRFGEAKAFISEGSGALLDNFIMKGATRAVHEAVTPAQISAADDAIARFADFMVRSGDRQPDGRIRLGEGSFSAAKNKFCPLYPFC